MRGDRGVSAAAELAGLDATAQAELVRRGDATPAELVGGAIESIEKLNPTLNAVVTPTFERALDEARGGVSGPLAGVPYLVKDLIVEVAGVRFTEGSRFLRDNVSRYDSELVIRLQRAGLTRSEEHTSELSHTVISYAVFCLKKKNASLTFIFD